MKKLRKWVAASSAMLVIPALAACSSGESGDDNSKDQPKSEQTTKQTKPVEDQTASKQPAKGENDKSIIENTEESQTIILEKIKNELDTKLPVRLPSVLPLEKGKHLTAVTSSDDERYQVTFYSTDEQVPVNDNSLPGKREDAVKIADYQVKKYETAKKAQEQIGYEDYSKAGGDKIDLGHGLTGYRDAGAGSAFISWNEGRWAIAARARTDNAKAGERLALKTVDYLEKHTLPAPNNYGSIHLDAEEKGTSWALWQDGETVYELNKVEDPMALLGIVGNLRQEK